MVAYEELIAFSMLIIAIVGLVKSFYDKNDRHWFQAVTVAYMCR